MEMSNDQLRHVTRFGLQIPDFTFPGVGRDRLFETIAGIAGCAESSGFDSVWVMDHFYQIANVGDRSHEMLEGYTLLGGLAARTSRISLGTLVAGVTYRNPAILAKQVTTLDVVSEGRAILGIGAAWNEDEHEGYGVRFPPIAERMDRLEEAIRICRAMFTEPAPSFEGRYYSIHEALNNPRPVRPGAIPILVGGGGERRTLAIVARYGDACNLFGDVTTIRRKLDVLDRHCETAGRDPAQITKTRLGTLVVAPATAAAETKARELARARGMDEDRYRDYIIAGDPDGVCEQVQSFLNAGLDGMIFNMHDAYDLDSVRLAGDTLTQAFG